MIQAYQSFNPVAIILTFSDAPSAYTMVLEIADWPSAVYMRHAC